MPSTITLPIFSKWCHISFEREMKSWMIYCAKVFPILLWYEQWLTGPHFGWLSSPYVLARKTTMSKTNSEKRRMNKIETLLMYFRPWSFKPVTDITGWYFFPVILFLLFPDKSIYSASINWSIGNALMKPITNYKPQEQDYRKIMSACNVSYRLKRSGPMLA